MRSQADLTISDVYHVKLEGEIELSPTENFPAQITTVSVYDEAVTAAFINALPSTVKELRLVKPAPALVKEMDNRFFITCCATMSNAAILALAEREESVADINIILEKDMSLEKREIIQNLAAQRRIRILEEKCHHLPQPISLRDALTALADSENTSPISVFSESDAEQRKLLPMAKLNKYPVSLQLFPPSDKKRIRAHKPHGPDKKRYKPLTI